MGLIQNLEDAVLSRVKKFFDPILRPLQKLWGILKGFFTALIDLVPKTIQLVKSVVAEVQAWRDFKKGISFKTGVINLQSARDRIEDLIQEVVDAWHSLFDLIKGGKLNPQTQIKEAAEALEEVVTAFEDFFGKAFSEGFFERLGGIFEKIGGKVFEVLALVQAIAEALVGIVDDLQTIVNAIGDVRKTFQTGEGLFLKQTNPRKVLTLEDGTKIKIRLGNLHQ